MRLHLTDIAVRALKPAARQYKVWDDTFPGFGLRVNSASKSWIVMHGRERKLAVLGRYPELSLKDARIAASRYLAQPESREPERSMTVQAVYELYVDLHCNRKLKESTATENKRLLQRHLLAKFRNRPINEVTKANITKITDALLDTPATANHAFAAIRGFMSWAVSRDYLKASPSDGLQRPAAASARERVLAEVELAKVFNTAKATLYPFGSIVRLLILTGQRRGEIAALRWEWIDETARTITFPSALTKNGREHVLPYGDQVAALLDELPQQGAYLFPAAKERRKGKEATIFAGWGKPKAAFDKACPIASWTLHDLRRTFATQLAALGTPIHVTEKLLNHVSGTVSGVAAIYNRHSYIEEMRAAIEAWETRLTAIVKENKADAACEASTDTASLH